MIVSDTTLKVDYEKMDDNDGFTVVVSKRRLKYNKKKQFNSGHDNHQHNSLSETTAGNQSSHTYNQSTKTSKKKNHNKPSIWLNDIHDEDIDFEMVCKVIEKKKYVFF